MVSTIGSHTASQPDRETHELTEFELANVSGGKGKATLQPFTFVKHYDKASPVLL